MHVWALADLHLSFGVPEKTMEVFGPEWANYAANIEKNWRAVISEEDLVLIPGDISWAMALEDAKIDLDWIGALPGTKVMIKGNHDYWWSSLSKIKAILPPSIHAIQNNAFHWNDFSIAGTRLWDSHEYDFDEIIEYHSSPVSASKEEKPDAEKIFLRELNRLELSLKVLDQKAAKRMVMVHYPPIGLDLAPSRTSALLEKYRVDICVFGHLHRVIPGRPLFGTARGVSYYLTSADYLSFKPLKLI